MRAFKRSATLAAAFVGLFVGSASAQDRVVVRIPFSFAVRGEQFAAGRYSLRIEDGILSIEGMDNPAGVFALTVRADGRDPAGDRPALVFTRYENGYRLSEIWDSDAEGFRLPASSGVPRLRHADARPGAAPAPAIVLTANRM